MCIYIYIHTYTYIVVILTYCTITLCYILYHVITYHNILAPRSLSFRRALRGRDEAVSSGICGPTTFPLAGGSLTQI